MNRIDEEVNDPEKVDQKPNTKKYKNPDDAATKIDALMSWIQKRYSDDTQTSNIATIQNFLCDGLEVKFIDSIDVVELRRNNSERKVTVLSPILKDGEDEEKRRIYLLSSFAPVIDKVRAEGILLIEQMLTQITDTTGNPLMDELISSYNDSFNS